MTNSNTEEGFSRSINRITSIYSSKKLKRKQEKSSLQNKQKFMLLNFELLASFLKKAQDGNIESTEKKKKRSFSFFPLFTQKILSSENEHLIEITKQAHACCSDQDFHLFPFKQFLLKDELNLRRIIEWNLSKFIKRKEDIIAFVNKMKESPPDIFKKHLVTLLSKDFTDEASQKDVEQEKKDQEDKWRLWKHHADGGPFKISPP